MTLRKNYPAVAKNNQNKTKFIERLKFECVYLNEHIELF